MSGCLEGKVAIVTGGASGIGRAVVERFVQEGAKVCVSDIDEDRLKELSATISGDRSVMVQDDVTRLEDNHRAVHTAITTFGKIEASLLQLGVDVQPYLQAKLKLT